jgi:hypothetical protein
MADKPLPRCEVTPLPDDQAVFTIGGRERLRWHFGPGYPRPFFFPLVGPTGAPLTRMGHPGDAGHDHHRSIWFAHEIVAGQNFWADDTETRIRQKRWLAYQDGDDAAVMAALLGWHGGDRAELMEQELVAAVGPRFGGVAGRPGETFVELKATFRPAGESLTLGKSNFGLLAVRVAKSISAHFGGGAITSSRGDVGEPAIFGKAAEWMDYSGPVRGADGEAAVEGVTYFDHPVNPGFPARWQVRSDGWMGASLCRDNDIVLRQESPLVARYLLHAHAGPLDAPRAAAISAEFQHTPTYEVVKAEMPHVNLVVRRAGE